MKISGLTLAAVTAFISLLNQPALSQTQSPLPQLTCTAPVSEKGAVEQITTEDQRLCQQHKNRPLLTEVKENNNRFIVALKKTVTVTGSSDAELKHSPRQQQLHIEQSQNHFIQLATGMSSSFTPHRRYTKLLNGISFTAADSDIKTLETLPQVLRIEKDHLLRPILYQSVQAIKAPKLWQKKDSSGFAVDGKGVRVAVLDTGIHYQYQELGGCFGPGCKVAGGYDFVNEDNNPDEDEDSYYRGLGHGTHVAGIIAANSDTLKGVAPGATLYAYKVCGPDLCATSDIIAALERTLDPDDNPATDDQVHLVNMSLGSKYGNADDLLSTSVNKLVDAGVTVVVAAGNDGPTMGFTGSPAVAEKAITVAASRNDNAQVASFSTRGPGKNVQFLKPDVTAPGEFIHSTFVNLSNPTHPFNYLSGTSMAAPHVAGGAALLLQLNPDLTPEKIKSRLSANATPFADDSLLAQGAGLINLQQANESQLQIIPASGLAQYKASDDSNWSKTFTFKLRNSSQQTQNINLAFTDAFPKGVTGHLSHKQMTLKAGNNIDIQATIQLSSDHFSNIDVSSIENRLQITQDQNNGKQHVPLVISLLNELKISADGQIRSLHILSETGEYEQHFNGKDLPSSILLPRSEYTIAAEFNLNGNKLWVFKENVKVDKNTDIIIKHTDAKHELVLNQYIDHNGDNILSGNLTIGTNLEFQLGDSTKSILSGFHMTPTQQKILTSDISSQFNIVWAGVLSDTIQEQGNVINGYSFSKSLSGIEKNIALNINASQLLKRSFYFKDTEALARGVAITFYSNFRYYYQSAFKHAFDGAGYGASFPHPQSRDKTLTEPFWFNLYGMPTKATLSGNQSFSVNFTYKDNDSHSTGFYSPEFAFQGPSHYVYKFATLDKEQNKSEAQYHYKTDTHTIDRKNYLLSGKATIQSGYFKLNKADIIDIHNTLSPTAHGVVPFYHDPYFRTINKRPPAVYKLYCNGKLDHEDNYLTYTSFPVYNCDKEKIEIYYNTNSRTTFDFSNTSSSKFQRTAPVLFNAYAEHKGKMVYAADQAGSEFVAEVHEPENIKSATLFIKYADHWQVLPFVNQEGKFRAQLPNISQGGMTAVHMKFINKENVVVTHTIRQMFKLGRDQTITD